MFEPLVPHVRRLLEEVGPLVLVDVGARNGVRALADVAEFVDAYGFEPNPEEFAKLQSGDTDAARAGYAAPRGYRALRHFPYALSNEDGTATLHVTRGPGAVGLLQPDHERLREIRWKGRSFDPNFADEIFEVVARVEVPVRRLDGLAAEAAIERIDLLKVDVEGSEYAVLEGAGSLLERTGVIRVEVCFIPFRLEQKLFSEVDLLLRRHGFDLIRYEIEPTQIGYKERTEPAGFGPELGVADRWGQPLSGDAVYVNRTLSDARDLARQAAVLADLNYLDEAAYRLRRSGLGDAALIDLLRTFRRERLHHQVLRIAVRGAHLAMATRAKVRQARSRTSA